MGFIHKQNKKLDKIKEEKIQAYLKDVNEVSKKHGLILIPIIGKYKADFEIQEIPREALAESVIEKKE